MVFSDPKVVILDEATSTLDVETAGRLHVALTGFLRGCTIIIIAHRLSAVRRPDRVDIARRRPHRRARATRGSCPSRWVQCHASRPADLGASGIGSGASDGSILWPLVSPSDYNSRTSVGMCSVWLKQISRSDTLSAFGGPERRQLVHLAAEIPSVYPASQRWH
jgi:hypothetical protein